MMRWKGYLSFLSKNPINWYTRFRVYESNTFQERRIVPIPEEEQMPEHTKVSCPKSLYEVIRQGHGYEAAQQVCNVMNDEPQLTVRANTLRTTRDDLLKLFKDEGWRCRRTEHAPHGIRFTEPPKGNLFKMV